MLQKVSEQRKESIKSQGNTDLSRIIEEQTQYRQRATEPEKEATTTKEKTRLAVTNALKMVLEDNEKTLKLLMESSKGKGSTDEEKLDQEDQRIQEVELEKLEEPTEESASIVCGDWMHRIKPAIKNLSKRSSKYWTRLDDVVEERYKIYLMSKPVEKLTLEFKEDDELSKDEYTKVKSVIQEMITKALPKGLRTEAVQKRYSDPEATMLMIMIKYQPGSRKEKEALLQQIQEPPQSWQKGRSIVQLEVVEKANTKSQRTEDFGSRSKYSTKGTGYDYSKGD
jgi:hypothetical protein